MFLAQLGVDDDEYQRTCDFKSSILDKAIKEINKHTDIKVSYEQEKDGKNIVGFEFKVLSKNKPESSKQQGISRDLDTANMFTIEYLNDKQLGRIIRNPAFMAEYNHLVSPAGQSQHGWEFEMMNRLKKDSSQFGNRPIRDYLK